MAPELEGVGTLTYIAAHYQVIKQKQKYIKHSCSNKLEYLHRKIFCIPESFTVNISHQLFDYTITFVNPQY